MSEINFNIYFNSDGNTQAGLPSDPSPDSNPVPEKNNPSTSHGGVKQIAGLATAVSFGKSALHYSTSHVQMYTGSSDMQDKTNATMGLIGTGTEIAANPVLGLAKTAFNLVTKCLDYVEKQREETINLAQARKRAGPNHSRSRYV